MVGRRRLLSSDRIYLTTAVAVGDEKVTEDSKYKKIVETPYVLRALCLSLETGETLWSTEVAQVPEGVSIHPKNSHASPSAIVSGDRVYVHFGTFGTAALSLDGELLWVRRIEYTPVHGSGGSPVVFEDLLIFNCDGGKEAFVIALEADTGKERWRTPRPDLGGKTFSFSTPLLIDVDSEPQLISAASNVVVSYNPRTGSEVWSARYPDKWSVVPRPVYAGGLVLICTGYDGPAELLAIEPSGKGDVTETHIKWRSRQFAPHNPSPVVHDGAIFMVNDEGIASCRDLKSGDMHWKKRLPGNHSASPFLAEGRIYFLSERGVCTVVNATTKYEQIAKNDLGERTLASMTPIEGGILARTETKLYRIE